MQVLQSPAVSNFSTNFARLHLVLVSPGGLGAPEQGLSCVPAGVWDRGPPSLAGGSWGLLRGLQLGCRELEVDSLSPSPHCSGSWKQGDLDAGAGVALGPLVWREAGRQPPTPCPVPWGHHVAGTRASSWGGLHFSCLRRLRQCDGVSWRSGPCASSVRLKALVWGRLLVPAQLWVQRGIMRLPFLDSCA